jgi:hypothetical protein
MSKPSSDNESALDPGPSAGDDESRAEPVTERRPRRDQRDPGRQRRPASREPLPEWAVVANLFFACARCGYFLAGYRLLHQDFEAAVEAVDGGWLVLSWSEAVGRLVEKSFGYPTDIESLYYSGICPDCHRSFIYEAAGESASHDTLRIQTRPR